MNNEIKEIERIFNILKNHNALADEEDTYLLKYITNLQQENERLKDIVVEKDNQLKDMILQKTDYTAVNILEMKLEDYKSRCEKAIEYIEKHFVDDEGIICKITGEMECEINYNFLEHLLNILQNGGEDNE